MKFKGPIFFSVVALLLLAAAYMPGTPNTEKEALLMQTIIRGLERYHFSPQTVDDDFSQKVYDLYINELDGRRRFLTQEDVDQLIVYRDRLDEEINAGSYEFFNLSQELLTAGLKKTQGFYREILDKPFDFSEGETVNLGYDDQPFARNDEELYDFWRKYLKYETLTRYAQKLDEQQEVGEEGESKSPEELEVEARQEVLEMFDDWYDRLFKLKREDRLSQYVNVITGIFDPHTNYFQPIDKENFDIRMSGQLEGIGARLMTEDDYTKVSEIVIGGPAWKTKRLQENDIILKVAQDGEEPVDLKGMVIDDVVQLVRGPKGTKVTLTVKKVDGSIEQVEIIRDVVVLDERFAKSLILDGAEAGEKVGYIYLPSFYANFQDRDGRNSADDVEKEIEKLKAEGVDGIILDLRNNGGGSLRDVVKMSGFFIEQGPIVQVKSRNQNPEVLSDSDPRVQYDGPLVVMVNQFSASASEILAAAMQDYERAVVVGSKSTFGKGTVQRFVDLDRTLPGFNELKPLGQVKLTTQKFYRIDGGSTQLRGVTPDVILPDNFHLIETGEREEDYALAWTEIDAVSHNQRVYRVDKVMPSVVARSGKRVQGNATFRKIMDNAERMKRQRDMDEYPLSLNEFQALEDRIEAEAELYDSMFTDVVNPGVFNIEVDLKSIHADESKEARNADFVQSVSKDVYIRESLEIMHDLIKGKQ